MNHMAWVERCETGFIVRCASALHPGYATKFTRIFKTMSQARNMLKKNNMVLVEGVCPLPPVTDEIRFGQ